MRCGQPSDDCDVEVGSSFEFPSLAELVGVSSECFTPAGTSGEQRITTNTCSTTCKSKQSAGCEKNESRGMR